MNESVRSEAEKFAGAKALNCCEPDRRPEGLLHPAFHRFVARARQGAKARSIETLYAAMNVYGFMTSFTLRPEQSEGWIARSPRREGEDGVENDQSGRAKNGICSSGKQESKELH